MLAVKCLKNRWEICSLVFSIFSIIAIILKKKEINIQSRTSLMVIKRLKIDTFLTNNLFIQSLWIGYRRNINFSWHLKYSLYLPIFLSFSLSLSLSIYLSFFNYLSIPLSISFKQYYFKDEYCFQIVLAYSLCATKWHYYPS